MKSIGIIIEDIRLMSLLNDQENKIMRTFIFVIMVYFTPIYVLAQKIIGTYDYYDRKGKQVPEKILLTKANGYYRFCFPSNAREEFYDSTNDGEKIKIRRIIHDNFPCAVSFGDYIFTKKQNAIFIKIYDTLYRKTMMHRQYPLRKNDTTSCATLFTNHYGGPTQHGDAVYLHDTTIIAADRLKYQCHVIQEFASGGYDVGPSVRKVFLDARSLLPIRIEEYEPGTAEMSYYLYRAKTPTPRGK